MQLNSTALSTAFVLVGLVGATCMTAACSSTNEEAATSEQADAYRAPVAAPARSVPELPNPAPVPWAPDATMPVEICEPLPGAEFRKTRAEKKVCFCESARVLCTSDLAPGAGASCKPAECLIKMSEQACATLGYKSGDQIATDSLNLPIVKRNPPPTNVAVMEFCTLRHELRHACDGPVEKKCETEIEGYKTSVQCLSDYIGIYCRAGDTSEFCVTLEVARSKHQLAGAYNTCKCAGGTRESCVADCVSTNPGSAKTCSEIGSLYK